MRIGETVMCESDFHSFEARLLAGVSLVTGEWTADDGAEIDGDCAVKVHDLDCNERLQLRGWMFSFEPVEAIAA